MARKPRVEFPGGFYHVIARGNRRANGTASIQALQPVSSEAPGRPGEHVSCFYTERCDNP